MNQNHLHPKCSVLTKKQSVLSVYFGIISENSLVFNQTHAINSAIAVLSPAAIMLHYNQPGRNSFPQSTSFTTLPASVISLVKPPKTWKLILPRVTSDLSLPQSQPQPQGNACLVQFQLCWNFKQQEFLGRNLKQQQFLGRLSPTPLTSLLHISHKHTQTMPSLYQPHCYCHPVSNKAKALTAAKGKCPNPHHIPLVNNNKCQQVLYSRRKDLRENMSHF